MTPVPISKDKGTDTPKMPAPSLVDAPFRCGHTPQVCVASHLSGGASNRRGKAYQRCAGQNHQGFIRQARGKRTQTMNLHRRRRFVTVGGLYRRRSRCGASHDANIQKRTDISAHAVPFESARSAQLLVEVRCPLPCYKRCARRIAVIRGANCAARTSQEKTLAQAGASRTHLRRAGAQLLNKWRGRVEEV